MLSFTGCVYAGVVHYFSIKYDRIVIFFASFASVLQFAKIKVVKFNVYENNARHDTDKLNTHECQTSPTHELNP